MKGKKIVMAGLTVVFIVTAAAITATGGRQETSQPQQPTYTPEASVAETPEAATPSAAMVLAEPVSYVETPESYSYPVYKYEYTDDEIDMLARTIWGEARGCSPDEQGLVVWTILQRVDDDRFPDTIEGVILEPNQFAGYNEDYPIAEDIREICKQVLDDWIHECPPPTMAPYAQTAPYLFFDGDGTHNWFREEWQK